MGSPFASSVFHQREFTFSIPSGDAVRGARGALVTPTVQTVIRFYLGVSVGNLVVEGSRQTYVSSQSAYITAVNGDPNVIFAPLLPGSIGRDADTYIKVLQVQKEAIASLTKVWGDKYIVQLSDRSILGNSSQEGF